jgi:YD repeat-containing protein
VFGKQLGTLFALLVCALLIGSAFAATERYDYDPLGRLIRVINGSSQATDYVYDSAGNLLEVRAGVAAAAPVVSGITPASIRRGETKPVTITGSGFVGASVSASDPSLNLNNLQVAPTQIKFDLAAAPSAATGAQTITIASAAGNATASITVAPLLPKVNVDPAPLAIPPDNVLRQFTIRLSHVDAVDHTIALSASNTNITVSPASVTIPAGQLSVPANIKGVTAGQSTINLSSATLGNLVVPIFITAEFVGITTSIAPILGVVLEGNPQQNQIQITPVTNPLVGVIVGSALRSIAPDSFSVGTTSATLTINGIGLETAQTVTLEPSTGVTLGSPSVASDGSTVAVSIEVAADAPITQRRIIIKNTAGVAFPAASPSADRINIVRPAPQIDSIEPLFGRSDTMLTLTVRGRNLHEAKTIRYHPSTGIATDAAPVVSSDGTTLTARVALGISAVVGDYAVAVTTPGGTSTSSAGPTNTFKIVNEIHGAVTPIVAPTLGIVLQDSSTPSAPPISLASQSIGVAFGPIASAVTPTIGIVGQDVILTVQGAELNGVTGINVVPNTGLTIGSVTVAADGKSFAVSVTIAADALQTLRKVKVMAGVSEIPFASAEASQFRVSLPLPEFDSITPITLQTGQAAVPLTVRGRNFQNASQVKVTPAEGMTITTPPEISGDGRQITVNVSAAANAVLGARLVTVVTPAGESSAVPGPANTLTLYGDAGSTFTPIVSSLVGVVKLVTGEEPPATSIGPVLAPALGIVLQEVTEPVSTTNSQFANAVGVAFGPTALSLDANGFAPGFNGSLIVQGHELDAVTAIGVVPATGITFGTPTTAPDGKQISVPMTVDAAAARGLRTLNLGTAAGSIKFADPDAALLRVGPGVPQIDSITPILAKQGDIVSMTIRGNTLHDAVGVTATPESGITFVPGTLVVNASGTELTVRFVIDSSAPLGSRVIQVVVPGATSDAPAVPANTFTVFSP